MSADNFGALGADFFIKTFNKGSLMSQSDLDQLIQYVQLTTTIMAVGEFTPGVQDSVWMILERVDVPSAPGYTVTNNTDVTMTSGGMVTIDSIPWTKVTGKPTLFTANQTLNTSDSVSFNRLTVTGASGIEGGEIELAKAPTSTLAGNVVIDVYENKLRFFEGGGNGRGFYLDLTTGANNTSTNIMSSGGGSDHEAYEITNTSPEGSTYSVSVGTDGVVTMTTARGGIEFGAMPEVGGPSHLHIMRPAGQNSSTDLYFGDDYNYVKMPGLYGSNPTTQQGVEIGSSLNEGAVSVWKFGTDGNLTLPVGGDILDSTGTSVLGGGTTLPTDASGYLVNDGAGNLSWAAGDGTFSGDYDDLTNKPTIPADVSDLTDTTSLLGATWPVLNTIGSDGPQDVAIGYNAHETFNPTLGMGTVAIGAHAGRTSQSGNGVAIGWQAAQFNQGTSGVAIGYAAGQQDQGANAIAIGPFAGNQYQGANAIAIGNKAGYNGNGVAQPANTIFINATGSEMGGVPAQTDSFYVNPIRSDDSPSNVLYYNTTTKEITHGTAPGGVTSYNDLTDKPVLFDGNYNSLTNKPTYRIAVTGSTGGPFGSNLQADSLALAGLNPTENIPSTYGGDLILQGGVGGANNDLYGEVRIKSGTIGANYEWHFTTDKKIKLPAGGDIVDSTGAKAFVSLATLKQVVAASTDFADFQTRIANMQ